MLARVGESHSYGTRAARSGLVVSMGNHTDWATLTEERRAIMSVAGFKRSSKDHFLVQYEAFQCGVAGCWVYGH
jgi:hypothetical protein